MSERQKNYRDISNLTMSEMNKIAHTKDGLRNFLASKGLNINAEFVQRGDPVEIEDLQKIVDIVEAIGPDKFNRDNPLIFRGSYPSSPGYGNPIIGLRDTKEQCIEVIKKYYLGESNNSDKSSGSEGRIHIGEEVNIKGISMIIESLDNNSDGTISVKAKSKK